MSKGGLSALGYAVAKEAQRAAFRQASKYVIDRGINYVSSFGIPRATSRRSFDPLSGYRRTRRIFGRRRRSYRRRSYRRYRKRRGKRISYRRTRTGTARRYSRRSKAVKVLNRPYSRVRPGGKRKRGRIRYWVPPTQVKQLEIVNPWWLFEGNSPYGITSPYDLYTTKAQHDIGKTTGVTALDPVFNRGWSGSGNRNWRYLNLCNVHRIADTGGARIARTYHRRSSRRIRVVDAKLMLELMPLATSGSITVKTLRVHYMLCQLIRNPERKDAKDSDVSIGVYEQLEAPNNYPYDKRQVREVSKAAAASQGQQWKVLETGYKTYKSYPKDAAGNEINNVNRIYFNLNKYMKGVEITYKGQEEANDNDGDMTNVERNGFYLFMFMEDRTQSLGSTNLGNFNNTLAIPPEGQWTLGSKFKIRWIDVEDNVRGY